jgi:hypothetical protein
MWRIPYERPVSSRKVTGAASPQHRGPERPPFLGGIQGASGPRPTAESTACVYSLVYGFRSQTGGSRSSQGALTDLPNLLAAGVDVVRVGLCQCRWDQEQSQGKAGQEQSLHWLASVPGDLRCVRAPQGQKGQNLAPISDGSPRALCQSRAGPGDLDFWTRRSCPAALRCPASRGKATPRRRGPLRGTRSPR